MMQRSKQLQRKRSFSNRGINDDDSDDNSPSKKSIQTVLHTFGKALIDLSKSIKRSDDDDNDVSDDNSDDDDQDDEKNKNQSDCCCSESSSWNEISITKNKDVCCDIQFGASIVDIESNLFVTFKTDNRVDGDKNSEVYGSTIPGSKAIKYMQMIDTVWWHDCFQYQKTVEPVNFGPKPTIVNYAVDSEECIKTICQSSVTSLSSCMSSIFQDNHDQLLHVVAFILLNYEPSSNYDFASSSMHQNTTNFFYDLFLFASLVLVDDDSCAGVISNYLRYYGIYAQWYEMDTKSLFAHHYYKKIVLFVFKYLQDNLTLSRQRSIQVDMVKYLDKFFKSS